MSVRRGRLKFFETRYFGFIIGLLVFAVFYWLSFGIGLIDRVEQSLLLDMYFNWKLTYRGEKVQEGVTRKAQNPFISPDIVIELPVGPEVITGSTRMKSGTAQKMALNMISTTAMVLLGKTYGNLMIDLKCRSEKLTARSRKMVMDLLKISYDAADGLLRAADGSVKIALVMGWHSCDRDTAESKLEAAGGFVSRTR